jgi:hypothetical protein
MDTTVDTITDSVSSIAHNLANYLYGAANTAAETAWNGAMMAMETAAGTALSGLANTASSPQEQQLYNHAAQDFFAKAAVLANGVQSALQDPNAALTAAINGTEQWWQSIAKAIQSGHEAEAFQKLGGGVILAVGAVDGVTTAARELTGMAGPTMALSASPGVAQAEQAAAKFVATEENVVSLEQTFGNQVPQGAALQLAEDPGTWARRRSIRSGRSRAG